MSNWSNIKDFFPELKSDDQGGLCSDIYLVKFDNGNIVSAYLSGDSSEDMVWWSDALNEVVAHDQLVEIMPIPE